MKFKHILFINLLFVSLMTLSAATVYQYMTGRTMASALSSMGGLSDGDQKKTSVVVTTDTCDTRKPVTSVAQARTPALKKLKVYQDACHSFVTDTMMLFFGMPVSDEAATKQAAQDAVIIKEFAALGIRPLIVAEPTDYTSSDNLDFALLAAGQYNPWLNTYFSQLKAAGITDAQMGIWTPYPEANLPYWNNNSPEYFAPAVNNYVAQLRTHFPTTQTSILLNSATYETTDFEWQNGDYASLMPYLKGITPGTINYAGLQGFPWTPPKGGAGPILNAAEFLNPELLAEAADYLKVKNVWYNTGTFSTKYALDPERKVTVTPEQRKAVLATITEQALLLQEDGYSVAINMFAQDKSKASEETDWSYWQSDSPFNSADTPVLTQFIAETKQKKLQFWLFDQ